MDYELIVSALQKASAFDLIGYSQPLGIYSTILCACMQSNASSGPAWKLLILNRRRIV